VIRQAGASTERSIARERLAGIRLAVRTGRVSFPAQIPVFAKQHRPDVQWRAVALYFVQGWSCGHLARRYGVTAGRIRQMIHKWIERATELGYLQRIPPQTSVAIPVVQNAGALTMQGGSLSLPAPVLQALLLADGKSNSAHT